MNINQRDGHYAGNNPFRLLVLESIRHFYGDEINGEMWSLGGKECLEYKFLKESGINIKEYHNVNRDDIDKIDGVITHSHTEFVDIHMLWKKPMVLSYDSTEGIVATNNITWHLLMNLVKASLKLSDKVLFLCNFMTGYSNTAYEGFKECRALRINGFKEKFEHDGFKLEEGYYTEGSKDKSTIDMTGFSILVYK